MHLDFLRNNRKRHLATRFVKNGLLNTLKTNRETYNTINQYLFLYGKSYFANTNFGMSQETYTLMNMGMA